MIAKKLHLKPGMRVTVANAPSGFSLGKPVGVAIEKSLKRDLDLVLLFATTQKELNARWPKALASVKQDGALWVSYPKKNSGIQTDLGMGEWDATKGSDWNPVRWPRSTVFACGSIPQPAPGSGRPTTLA